MTDLASEFQETARAPTDSSLSRVATLAERLVALDSLIEDKEAELKALAEQRRLIAESDLPAAMDECGDHGLASFTLGDGSKVSVALKYRCGQLDDLPDDPRRTDRRPLEERLSALAWLEDNGHGDLARRVITVSLGRGSEDIAERILTYLRELRLNTAEIKNAVTVPWNTLSAFVKELDSGQEPVPFETLGVQKVRVAEVKRPKPNAGL